MFWQVYCCMRLLFALFVHCSLISSFHYSLMLVTPTLATFLAILPDDPAAESRAEALWAAQPALAQAVTRTVAQPQLGARRSLETSDLVPLLGLRAVQQLVCGLEAAARGVGLDGLIAGLGAHLLAMRVGVSKAEDALFAAWLGDARVATPENLLAEPELRKEIAQHADLSLAPSLDGDRLSMLAQCVVLANLVSRSVAGGATDCVGMITRAARVGIEPRVFRQALPDFVTSLQTWGEIVGHPLGAHWPERLKNLAVPPEVETLTTELARVYRYLLQNATTDATTGLANRRAAHARLETEWAAARRRGAALSCITIEPDVSGNGVEVANLLKEAARMQDVLCRVGDERFMVICVDTGEGEAAKAAARLCRVVSDAHLDTTHGVLTVSLGVASLDSTISSAEEFMRRTADAARVARNQGGNRFAVWQSE